LRTAYVVQNGATLRRNGDVLQVFVERARVAEVPVHDLGQLVVVGSVLLTPAAFDLVLERNVDTVFLTHHGKYRARLVGRESSQIALRLAQVEHLRAAEHALALGRIVVRGKIHNQRAWLLHAARRNPGADGLRRAAVAMQAAAAHLERCADLDAVRGCEGAAAAAYFKSFGEAIRAEGFSFDGRNRRPPLDPVNALLSLGYTLLTNAVESAIHVVGLDPYLGALHGPQSGRPSLACDLVEEHRAPVVDSLVVAAINRGAMRPEDFEDAGPGEPVAIRREALRKFVRLFERRLERRVAYAPLGTRETFRRVIELQARRFARHVLGRETYECFLAR
jgi:CRISPR-associated protein Cas1